MKIVLTEEQIELNYARFKKYIEGYIKVENIQYFLYWLDTTNCKVAPATTKYNGSYRGGFVEHCLNVFTRMFKLLQFDYGDDIPYDKQTIAVVSLLHDLDKIDKYEIQMKNKKDENGNWIQEPFYSVKDTFNRLVYGNPPQNTIYIIEQFFPLTYEEKLAIMYQSGGIYEGTTDGIYAAMNTFKVCPLAYYLYQADFYYVCEVGSKYKEYDTKAYTNIFDNVCDEVKDMFVKPEEEQKEEAK